MYGIMIKVNGQVLAAVSPYRKLLMRWRFNVQSQAQQAGKPMETAFKLRDRTGWIDSCGEITEDFPGNAIVFWYN